jgi:hypothetical protein
VKMTKKIKKRKTPLTYREYIKRRNRRRTQKKLVSEAQSISIAEDKNRQPPLTTPTAPTAETTAIATTETTTAAALAVITTSTSSVAQTNESKKAKKTTAKKKSSVKASPSRTDNAPPLPNSPSIPPRDMYMTRSQTKKRKVSLILSDVETAPEKRRKSTRKSEATDKKTNESQQSSAQTPEKSTTPKENDVNFSPSQPTDELPSIQTSSSLPTTPTATTAATTTPLMTSVSTCVTPLTETETSASKCRQRNIFEVPSDNDSPTPESESPIPSPAAKASKVKLSSKTKRKTSSKRSEESRQSKRPNVVTKGGEKSPTQQQREENTSDAQKTQTEDEKNTTPQFSKEKQSKRKQKKTKMQRKSSTATTPTPTTPPTISKSSHRIGRRELLAVQQNLLTPSSSTHINVSRESISPMEISLGVSRFGRKLLPPLAFWAGEVARKDAFGNIIEITKVRSDSHMSNKASPTTIQSPLKKKRSSIQLSRSEADETSIHESSNKSKTSKNKKPKLEAKTKVQSTLDFEERKKENFHENDVLDVDVDLSNDEDKAKKEEHSQVVTISLPLTTKAKHTTTKRIEENEQNEEWTEEQLKCLREAQRRVDPRIDFYWREVAKYVPGKTAQQCKEKIEQQFCSGTETKKTRKKKPTITSPINIDSNLNTRKNKRKIREALKKAGEVDVENKDAFQSTPFRTRYGDINIDVTDEEDGNMREDRTASDSKEVPQATQTPVTDDPLAPPEEFKRSHSLKFDEDNEDNEDVLLKDIDRDKFDSYVNRISKLTQRRIPSTKVLKPWRNLLIDCF